MLHRQHLIRQLCWLYSKLHFKMMVFLFLCLAGIATVHSTSPERKDNHSVSAILDRILVHEKYDKRLRPSYGDGPVVVTVGFWVLSIDSINVVDMDYTLDIFLRQAWRDERMEHELNTTMFLSNTVMDRIWMPDSYFVNAKHGSFHKVTKDNIMIMIGPGGIVQYNARVTIRLSCPMDLRTFPMDTQQCPLTIESYGYSTQHIVFKWEIENSDGMGFVPKTLRMLPQYKLSKVELSTLHNQYVVGNWSGLKASFVFQRLYSYFVIHVYGPCSLIVVISWVSFLLPREQAPARITLGVTSVLTVVTVLNMLNNSMPKVNYVKTIDKYLIGCFLFVFLTLVEYSLVLWFSKILKKYKKSQEEWRKQHGDPELAIGENVNVHDKLSQKQKKKMDNGKICSTQIVMMEMQDEKETFFQHSDTPARNNRNGVLNSPTRRPTTSNNPFAKLKSLIYSEAFVSAIDGYALVIFPLAFIIFNLVYWMSIYSFSDIFGF